MQLNISKGLSKHSMQHLPTGFQTTHLPCSPAALRRSTVDLRIRSAVVATKGGVPASRTHPPTHTLMEVLVLLRVNSAESTFITKLVAYLIACCEWITQKWLVGKIRDFLPRSRRLPRAPLWHDKNARRVHVVSVKNLPPPGVKSCFPQSTCVSFATCTAPTTGP